MLFGGGGVSALYGEYGDQMETRDDGEDENNDGGPVESTGVGLALLFLTFGPAAGDLGPRIEVGHNDFQAAFLVGGHGYSPCANQGQTGSRFVSAAIWSRLLAVNDWINEAGL